MEIGIYIHIPFCKSKCHYCDFASYANYDNKFEVYIDALIKEIELYKDELKNKYKVKTIFVGGGTPSVLPSILLEKLLLAINDNFNISENVEFTIESNPGTLSKKKLDIMRKYKVNRISLGVQAFQDNLLKLIGRGHTVEDVVSSYNMCREAGFDNINMDLIFGLPSQTKKEWKETLSNIILLEPEHISTYSLIIEDGTKFGDMYNQGQLEIIDDDLERDMYWFAKEFLAKNNYNQYEISNFARPGKESIHNMDCWKLKEYIGIGLGSHSYYDNYRYNNIYNMKEYISNSHNLELIQENKEYINVKSQMEEYMFLGLRLTKGINIKHFKKKFGQSIFDIYKDAIKEHIQNKLLILEGDNIFLSDRGQDLSNRVFISFLID